MVEGEVIDPFLSRNGHFYFRLRDRDGELKAVMWGSDVRRSAQLPETGERITVRGSLTLYPKRGDLQLKVSAFFRTGLGEKLEQLNRLKEKLRREGVFDRPKRTFPRLPKMVGLVTSVESAVLHDIHQSLRQRNPSVRLILSPSAVSGVYAAQDLVIALERLKNRAEVVIIARGGGSFEELLPFSDEALIRAVAEFPVPVISAIGHGTDETLLDLAADLSVPTPTAAAVAVTADRGEMLNEVHQLRSRLRDHLRRLHHTEAVRLASLQRLLQNFAPTSLLRLHQQTNLRLKRNLVAGAKSFTSLSRDELRNWQHRLLNLPWPVRLAARRQEQDSLLSALQRAYTRELKQHRQTLSSLKTRCLDLGPNAVLERGFALLIKDGQPVDTVHGRRPGEELEVRLSDGVIAVEIRAVHPNPRKNP